MPTCARQRGRPRCRSVRRCRPASVIGAGRCPRPAANSTVPERPGEGARHDASDAAHQRARAPDHGRARQRAAAKPKACSRRSAAVAPRPPSRLDGSMPVALLRLASSGVVADERRAARQRCRGTAAAPAPRMISDLRQPGERAARIGQRVGHRRAAGAADKRRPHNASRGLAHACSGPRISPILSSAAIMVDKSLTRATRM